jgi:hypothetical protein
MRTVLIALTAFFLLSDPRAASAQIKPCLHDQLESQANRARREKALELAEDINQAQGLARRFGPRGQGDYKPLDQLTNLPDVPEGFRVQLHTDGTTYSFSIKDTRDPCGYAVFSDQSLDIYEAVPSTRQVRSRLLTQE